MKQRYIEVPSTWDELTGADWRDVLKLRQLVATTGHQWTVRDVRIETAHLLLRNHGLKPQPGNPQWLLLVNQVAGTLDWLWQDLERGLSLCYRSTEQLLPMVKVGQQQLLGPQSHGADLLFGEFRMAYAIMRNYEQRPSGRDLNVLAGLLYRPAASEELQRERQLRRWPYEWDSMEQRERRGQQMKPWQVWGCYAWFAFFCEYLTTGRFIIDGEEVTFAPLFNVNVNVNGNGNDNASSVPAGSPGASLQRICLTLAESHVFGTVRDVDQTPLLTVMMKLLQDYEQLQRMKKQMKNKSK